MRISHTLPVFAAVLAGAVLSLAAAAFSARAIESTSVTAVENEMRLGGYDWVEVSADGLQIVLTGTAPDEQSQLAAQRAAGHVVDSSRVMNVMNVVQQEEIPAPRFSIEILRNDDGISLIGLVPASWDRAGFVADLKKAGGTGSVADLMEQADYPSPENWAEAMEFGLEAISRLPRSKISLAADAITVTALADSRTQKASFERALKSQLPEDVPVKIDIAAPRPVITPFTVRFVIDEAGPRFDACAVETPQGHLRILAAAKSLGLDNPECTVGLGSPSAQWAAAVETGMRALAGLGQGSITFADGDVTLIAAEGTSPDAFDATVGELETDLPRGFTLHSSLPRAEAEEGETRPEFVITRSPEGQTQLRGRIADTRSRAATEALARAAFGTSSVYSALREDGELPAGWSVRVMAAIEALSHLSQGAAVMTEDLVTVRGQTGDQNAKAAIAGLLAEQLGEGAEFRIDVAYVRKLDPVLNLPTPEECVARANQIVAVQKIVFDPGSTELNEAANDTLDRIAEALKECEDVEMEIGAHSDSQGRDEMNLELSVSRANAVLDGLLMRRVVGVSFTAHGYGETQPIADNDTEEGREANRRIEFKLLAEAAEDPAAEDGSGDDATPEEGTEEAAEEEPAADEGTE
ncbi:OmpA family protein [Celeribacter indicus]|uniref:OmpA-like protein n=1 Tax=Celeribacter indicus TaxID=1208324 RepID=A0A0B5E142_9RHOB|nr:OmpA family protein [Celeribacter indicus]AJE49004.1 OmpA-like protein [Celeribacter indicus]SDW43458.1 OmpA-OmpF porin, OOP family [Celeribacter indicus]